MKIEFIKTDPDNTRLILLFAGWSAGPETGNGIDIPGWDIAVAYDFTELTLDTDFLNRYYTVYLFAWSLGVYAASVLLPADRITAAFAINGTLCPVNDSEGIPEAIFRGTADNLDCRNLLKFRLRMTGGDRDLLNEICGSNEDDVTNLRMQLYNIEKHHADYELASLPWIRAYISSNDRIFPPENMRRHWSKYVDTSIIETDDAHYVPLRRIAGAVIADTQKVSRRFSKAAQTYDTQAIAQYSAAIKLTAKLAAMHPEAGGNIVEIGCGTGLYTHEYARILRPKEATFVDITQTGPFGIAEHEEYVVEDAERWIARQPEESVDAILSASAIQWFADIPRFLNLCARLLTPGGVLAISTFAPGNMEELDNLRPSPLLYPKTESLRTWLQRDFEDVEVTEDCIKVEFQSVREMLMHLKHTGVAGSASGPALPHEKMSHLRSLTYRPVYMLARKPR